MKLQVRLKGLALLHISLYSTLADIFCINQSKLKVVLRKITYLQDSQIVVVLINFSLSIYTGECFWWYIM